MEENEISINSNGGTEISKRSIANMLPESLLEDFQVICSRYRNIKEDKIRVYWMHDLADDPEMEHLKIKSNVDKFHQFVFVSNWQLQQFVTYHNIPMNSKIKVIENPIVPIDFKTKSKDQIRLVYFSTPQRGLEILIPVFKELCNKTKLNLHLDVYSSFKIYGWEDADKSYEPLFKECRNHPQITYHGTVPQEQMRAALQDAHILAFPSIWPETSCRVLIESMSAGLLCVHPNLAALPETSGGLTQMYQFHSNTNEHANVFYNNLEHAVNIVNNDEVQNMMLFNKQYTDYKFNINRISNMWFSTLTSLKDFYPVGSRGIQTPMYVYNT
jgi:glycosyltransferase involved in cell wall biosynthesis